MKNLIRVVYWLFAGVAALIVFNPQPDSPTYSIAERPTIAGRPTITENSVIATASVPGKREISPEMKAHNDKIYAEAKAERDREAANRLRMAVDLMTLRQLKNAMHDPDSFRVEQALRMNDGSLCVTYRARNGFNAMRTGHAVAQGGKITSEGADAFRTRWNRYCGGKTGTSLADLFSML